MDAGSRARPIALIEPHFPTVGRGRRPPGLENMLRIYLPERT